MSLSASSHAPGRRGKHRLGPRGPHAWGAGEEEEEAWAGPPLPRRSRWERPGPDHWGPEEPLVENEFGPGPGPPFPPLAPWDRKPPPPPADFQQSWGSPPAEGGGSLEQPRRQRMPRLGGGRWSSPERPGGGRRWPPSPGQGAWDGPEARSRPQGPDGERRAWGGSSPGREGAWERSRNAERPAWEQRPGSPGGRWASAGRRKEASQSPGRERRSSGIQECRDSMSDWSQAGREEEAGGRWGRTGRRGREQHRPARKQSGWGSPKREARQERSGSARHHAREQGQANPDEAGSRWSSAWSRERNRSRDKGGSGSPKGERQSPNGEARGQGSPMGSRGVENLDGGGAEGDSHERGGEEKRTDAAGSGSPKASASLADLISGISAVPKEWTPCESVVNWWMQCQSKLPKKMSEELRSICPRPTLPDRSSETPQVNPAILSLLNDYREKELRRAMFFTLMLQDEVLDMLAPAMTICEMAEEAMEKGEPVDPMELREWSRRLIRFLGSINSRLTAKNRSLVLGSLNPRLKMVVTKMSGQSTEGMLFADDKVKLLKEIIVRFPQLSEPTRKMPRRRFRPFNPRAANYMQAPRRPFVGSRFTPRGTGKRGTAGQRVEQSYSQGAGDQGPAEWR